MDVKPKIKTLEELLGEKNITLRNDGEFYYIQKENKVIKISFKHKVYLKTLVRFFDFHFDSVVSELNDDLFLVDFSEPKNQKIIGFDEFEIMCPSLAEPYGTVQQYLEIACLNLGDIVFDLGSYSGLTTIAFSNAVGDKGKIIAVEPDNLNYQCLLENVQKTSNNNIETLKAAIWNETGELEFSNENSMGSSAVSIVGDRGSVNKVQCFTLSNLVTKFNLHKVDFIKCDIEGAEVHIFDDEAFFNNHKPKILLETHIVNGEFCDLVCIEKLEKFGYKFRKIKQFGLDLPLLEFYI